MKKNWILCGVVYFLCGFAHASSGSIEIQTTDGKRVLVSSEEVRSAFLRLSSRSSDNLVKREVNQDGSVTLIEPRFLYKGANRYFLSPYAISDSLAGRNGPREGVAQRFLAIKHMHAICKTFGHGAWIEESRAGETHFVPNSGARTMVMLRVDGQLYITEESDQGVTDLTCTP